MTQKTRNDVRRQAWWGVLLLAIGAFFLVRELALFDVPSIGDLWPAFVVAFGLVRLASQRNPDDVGTGLFFTGLGLWFFANELSWWDMGYRRSWPVILIIWGFATMVEAILENRARSRAGGAS